MSYRNSVTFPDRLRNDLPDRGVSAYLVSLVEDFETRWRDAWAFLQSEGWRPHEAVAAALAVKTPRRHQDHKIEAAVSAALTFAEDPPVDESRWLKLCVDARRPDIARAVHALALARDLGAPGLAAKFERVRGGV